MSRPTPIDEEGRDGLPALAPVNPTRASRRYLPRLPSSPRKAVDDQAVAEFDRLKASATPPAPFSFFGGRSSVSESRKAGPRVPSAQYQPVSEAEHEAFARRQQAALDKKKHFLPRMPSMPRNSPVNHGAIEEFDRIKATNAQGNRASARLFPVSPLGGSFTHSFAHLPTSKSLAHLPSLAHIHTKQQEDEVRALELSQPAAPVIKFKTVRERVAYEIKHRHACERALMACFAVSLLWLTSLAVAQSIVYNQIVGPSMQSVVVGVETAVNMTELQRNAYETCANITVLACNATFMDDFRMETERNQLLLDGNRVKLDLYNETKALCSDNFANVILLLDYLTTVRGELIDPVYGNLTRPECSAVAQMIKDQMAAIRAHSVAEAFQAETDEVMTSLFNQYRARAAYDKQYALNSTGAVGLTSDSLNQLVANPRQFFQNMSSPKDMMYACMNENGTYGSATCQGDSVLKSLANGKAQLVQAYTSTTQAANNYFNEVGNVFAPLQNFYTKFSKVLKDVAGLRDQLNGAASDNNGGSLDAMGYSDNPPSLNNLPQFISESQLGGLLAGGFDQIAARAMGKQQAADASTAEQMNQDEANTKQGQSSWQATFFSDYNPPPYDAEDAEVKWKSTTSQFLPAVTTSLQAVSTRSDSPQQAESYESTLDASGSGEVAKELLQVPPITPLSFYSYDNIDPQIMLGDWNHMTGLALYMDYTYRILHSIAIIRSYWRISSVLVPPADVRVGSVPRGQTNRVRLNSDQLMAKILTHPVTLLGVVIIFLGIICSMFLALYLPIFEEYVKWCVRADPNLTGQGFTGTGTMITSNSYVVATEYANGPGDSLWTSGVDRINIQRELMCTKNENWVYQQQRIDTQEYNFYNTKYAQLLAQVQTFNSCVNFQLVDSFLGPSEVLLATNGTRGGWDSLNHPTCRANFPALDPAAFMCNNITSCSGSCSGSTMEEFKPTIYLGGCNLERYMHSGVLGWGLSALTFILMNLSRCVVLRGLRRVFMRHFAQAEYSYLGTTSELGEIEYPQEVVKDGQPFKEFLMWELHQTIKNFERVGYFIVAFGLLLNIPWVFGLVYMSGEFNAAIQ
ncbi:hypothetical protein BASA81_006826 [Batrachochytrium salamandrivorans]|nr:hypothetical protein BASA81_006826 [Batrachochytrium salamandrivorans]